MNQNHSVKRSLSEVNQSVEVPHNSSFWNTLRAFLGPGALVAVGYMDPGNWITSVIGGATYRYLLLFVVLVSSLMAMQLQQMAGKLGIVTRQDLAQATASRLPKPLRYLLFIIIELALIATDLDAMFKGFLPHHELFNISHEGKNSPLTLALGIIGATVMPHNLYLHSSLSQTRRVDYHNKSSIKKAVRFMTLDSNIQLSLAFVVNSLLLVLGASLFYGHANDISAFSQMYLALSDKTITGAVASSFLSTLFAVALLASGQNSTITGTLTGQIVMEGFLHFKLPQWLIRLCTRLLTLLPIFVIALLVGGEENTLDQLIVYSQVFLSLALPFSIFPLIYFTSQKSIMGEHANAKWNTYLAYLVAIILTLLNLKLIMDLL
ncbi:TPA: Nramp family divalent metal transporter [Streptococcus agalactiae]